MLRSVPELRRVLGELFTINVPSDAALDVALARLVG